jgi:uncharacterized FlgJ-related protein
MNKTDFIRDAVLIALFVAFGTGLGFVLNRQTTEHTIKTLQAKVKTLECDTLTEDCLKTMLEKSHIKFSHIVLAQAKLESSSFQSDLTKTHNNIFGMKVPAGRLTFATNWHDYENWLSQL